MATYGKKKRSILPSFSVLRDSNASLKLKRDKHKRPASIALTVSAFHDDSDTREQPQHADSIDEMASMLLDETSSNVQAIPARSARRYSYITTTQTQPSDESSSGANKALPHLPKLCINRDNARAMNAAPILTAGGAPDQSYFNDDVEEFTFRLPKRHHAKNQPAPKVPRRSSKRKSGRLTSNIPSFPHKSDSINTQSALNNSQLEASDHRPKRMHQSVKTSMFIPSSLDPSHPKPARVEAADVNDKIEAMLAATRALKGTNDNLLLQGPYLTPKKRRLMDHKVLTKMRTAINDRLQVRNTRKADYVTEERLLNSSVTDVLEFTEDLSMSAATLTTMEIRMNEGDNFRNPKIFNLTGHGNVRRKPIAEDGKSLRSRKSGDDPFSERSQSGSLTRTPTSVETRLRDDTSEDQSIEYVPDLPSQNHIPKFKAPSAQEPIYGAGCDDLLSSSPVAQSTPRIRLEPTFDDGKKTLENTPAESDSLFNLGSSEFELNLDMKSDSCSTSKAFTFGDKMKRKTSHTKARRMKKIKKHPSPSKSELENLERAMKNFPSFGGPRSFGEELIKPMVHNTAHTGSTVLASKDPNSLFHAVTGHHTQKGLEMKEDFTKTTQSMPGLPNRNSASKAVKKKGGRTYTSQFDLAGASIMDIDELQWDISEYNIGMKRS